MSQQIPERFSGGAVDLSHLASRPTHPAPQQANGAPNGSQQVIDVPALVLDVADQTFEQIAQLSNVVPVVLHLRADENEQVKQLDPILEKAVRSAAGRILLGRVDVYANPGLAQAFQAQSVPTVVALVSGRPVPLFQGVPEAEQIAELFSQLLQLAEQQGVSGRVNAPDTDGDQPLESTEPPVNPAHEEALDAVERGDYAAAVLAYEQVLAKSPADHEARAALVQVRLLERLQGEVDAEAIRQSGAANPLDVDAQLRVADLDVSGGHVEDAFLRLLDLFAASDAEDARTRVRERLLELFEVVGPADPRVAAARTRLANLLY